MKFIAASLLWLQAILFIVLTVAVLWMFGEVVKAGAWFDARFASAQWLRLIAFLAPYLVLPISIAVAFVLYRAARYRVATWLPMLFVAVAFAAGQTVLSVVPDPIEDNFGARASPYPGFLVLPKDAVPAGFAEVKHHYTKREYTISFKKKVAGQTINLDIVEGDRIWFGTSGSELVHEFQYRGVTGQVYIHHHKTTLVTSYRLLWLNPPKQRISIHLTQTPNNDYSPQDLIAILKNMMRA